MNRSDPRRISLEIVPIEVNEARAKQFGSNFLPTSPTLGWRDEGSEGGILWPKNTSLGSLRQLEAKGIIKMMKPFDLNLRSGISAKIGFLAEGVDEAEIMRQYKTIDPMDSDVSVAQTARLPNITDVYIAQNGEPMATTGKASMLMRIVPQITQKDGKDAVRLNLEVLIIPVQPPQGSSQPQVRSKAITTDAIVADSGSIVLGGWSGETRARSTTRFPMLGKLPIVGEKLFSRHMQVRERTTVLIMVRCKIES